MNAGGLRPSSARASPVCARPISSGRRPPVVVLEARECRRPVLTIRRRSTTACTPRPGRPHRRRASGCCERGQIAWPHLDAVRPSAVPGRAIQARPRRPPPARGALTRDLKPDDNGLDQAGLLDRYIGVLPSDLAEPAATADSYARWGSYDRVTWPDYLRSRGAAPEAIKLMTLGGDPTEVSALYVLRQVAMLRRSTQR